MSAAQFAAIGIAAATVGAVIGTALGRWMNKRAHKAAILVEGEVMDIMTELLKDCTAKQRINFFATGRVVEMEYEYIHGLRTKEQLIHGLKFIINTAGI